MTLLEMTSRYEELVAKENLTESENREYISLRIELTKIQEELGNAGQSMKR